MNTAKNRSSWDEYSRRIHGLLSSTAATDADGHVLDTDQAFEKWRNMTIAVKVARKALYLVGNGASASMASHCAADIMKNGGLRATTFTDLSLVTALGNDLAYDQVFSAPLAVLCDPGDMCVAISSSGRSPSIVNAVDEVRSQGGIVVTVSGFDAKNPLRSMGDLNFYISAEDYGHVESCHAALLHYWMDSVIACARNNSDEN